MRKTLTRVALVATLATSLVASFATTANAAGTNKTQTNGSYGPVFLFDSSVTDAMTSFNFDSDVYASGSSTFGAVTAIDCPASTSAFAFATARGTESTKTSWTASTTLAFFNATTTVKQGNLKLSGLTTGKPNDLQASGVATRDWSLGIACVSGSSVLRTYYRYITVTTATGAWTAAASDYVYPTPTLSDNHLTNTHDALHTGDTLTATVGADTVVPDGFSANYQWYSGDSTLLTNETNATYLLKDTDGGLTFKVRVTYTKSGANDVVVYSLPTATVVGNSNLTGSVTMNASVAAATNGQLALSFVNAATGTDGQYARSVSLTGVLNNVTNQSVSTGSLPDIKVSDGRVTSLAAWTLSASVTDFGRVTGQSVSTTDLILKSALGITPTVDSKPADRTVTAGTPRTSGQAFATAYVLASTAAVADPGNDGSKVYTGDTVVKTTLSLLAPQWKTAGNYQSTMSLTLVGQ